MAVTIELFLKKVEEIRASNPKRREPGDGSDGYCDCIGLIIGAIRRCGLKWSGIHGSNWAARKEAVNLRPITNASQLELGDVVLKGCSPGVSGYALPTRYKKGGQYYTGDLVDYYHAGVVTSVNPLRITHMSTKMKVDTQLGKWNYAMRAKPLVNAGAYNNAPVQEPVQEPAKEDPTSTVKSAVVNGTKVALRAQPNTGAQVLVRVDKGERVQVLGDTWTKVTYQGKTGYMMSKFLKI